MTPAPDFMDALVRRIRSYRFRYVDEKRLQDGIEKVIALGFGPVYREHRFSFEDRVDFFLPDLGLALEVKIKGNPVDVVRQLTRYASHPEVKGILLVSARLVILQHIPDTINGKPVRSLSLSASLL